MTTRAIGAWRAKQEGESPPSAERQHGGQWVRLQNFPIVRVPASASSALGLAVFVFLKPHCPLGTTYDDTSTALGTVIMRGFHLSPLEAVDHTLNLGGGSRRAL